MKEGDLRVTIPVFQKTGEDEVDDGFGFGGYDEGGGLPCFVCDLDFGGFARLRWIIRRFEGSDEVLGCTKISHDETRVCIVCNNEQGRKYRTRLRQNSCRGSG